MPTVAIAYDNIGTDMSIEEEVLRAGGVEIWHIRSLNTDEARDTAAKADALMVTIQQVPADLIRRLERCKIIARVGTGLDAIDIPAATECGIWVTNVPD